MRDWLHALAQAGAETAVLVTVAAARGSSPRETGAKMAVTASRQFDTIGGGQLELRALEIARAMLRLPNHTVAGERRLERFPLAARLGQCCGGVVHLAFERIAAEPGRDSGHVRQLLQCRQARQDAWRLTALDQPLPPLLCARDGARIGATTAADMLAPEIPRFDPDAPCHVMQTPDGHRWLVDPCLAPRAHLYLFGAGHVGAALVRVLADLPCCVTWIDQRDDLFPAQLPANVQVEVTDTPLASVGAAAPGSHFLVMTHSHALDQDLVEAILRRGDAGWLGLIGSHSKRSQFERRLRARGIGEQQLAGIACPIGVPGIRGKQPAVIAVAVAAQLLQIWEAARQTEAGQRPLQSTAR